VALLTIKLNHKSQLYYLTPIGNMKPVFPPFAGFICSQAEVCAEGGRFFCASGYGPGMALLDVASGQIITATQDEGYHLVETLPSPDGRWVVYLEEKPHGGGELLVGGESHYRLRGWEVDTDRVYTITEEMGSLAPLPLFWSSATGKVYWTLGRPQSEGCCYGFWGALPTGEEKEELPTGVDFGGQLSPDGRRVVFPRFNPDLGETYMERIYSGSSRNEVALLDLQDRTVRLLWQADPGCQLGPEGWLPDEQIALVQVCSAEEQYQWDIFTIDLSGTKVATLWSDRSSEWDGAPLLYPPAAGDQVLAVTSPQGVHVWWLLNWRSGEKRVLPDGNRIYWTWCGEDLLLYTAEDRRSRLDMLNVVTGESTFLWEEPGGLILDILTCR
jgi:hypothetical protein